jgi:hypothetical protein
MKYLLFVYGNYNEHPFILKNIAKLLSDVSSVDVKYQFGDSGAIYHFSSLMKTGEIKKKITEPLQQLTAMYFMVPFNKNVNFYIDDKKIQNHLFNETVNTDNLSDSIKVEYNLDDIKNDIISVESDEFISGLSEFLGVDLSRFINEEDDCLDVLTLDEILDKINENGIESLTVTEKIILDEYSKG